MARQKDPIKELFLERSEGFPEHPFGSKTGRGIYYEDNSVENLYLAHKSIEDVEASWKGEEIPKALFHEFYITIPEEGRVAVIEGERIIYEYSE